MTPKEAHEQLRAKIRELIIARGVQHNGPKIMSLLEGYIDVCRQNSRYDQVANANTLVRMLDRGQVTEALGAIQYKDTLTHINRLP